MKVLTEDAVLVCDHELGTVGIVPTQNLVTISRRKILVENNPEGRPISRCPNIGIAMKPCQRTFAVQSGYSLFVRIGGKPVCLDIVTGVTDGTPPGVKYKVRRPGQDLVSERP